MTARQISMLLIGLIVGGALIGIGAVQGPCSNQLLTGPQWKTCPESIGLYIGGGVAIIAGLLLALSPWARQK